MNAKEVIKKYLDERAAADPLFAESYTKKDKSIDKCFWYICDEAKKRAKNNVTCMTREEVFGLAVHYYDEDDIKVDARLADDAKVDVEVVDNSKNPMKDADPAVKKLSMAELAEARKKAVEFWKKKIGADEEEKREIELAVKREKEAERKKAIADAKKAKAVAGMGSLF